MPLQIADGDVPERGRPEPPGETTDSQPGGHGPEPRSGPVAASDPRRGTVCLT